MLALAAQELAKNLPAVDHITITPDLLTSLVAGLGGGGSRPVPVVEGS